MRKFQNVKLPDVLQLNYIDGDKFELNAPYRVTWEEDGSKFRIEVPKGYITDLSSIPRLAQSVIPVIGRQNGPSVIHDFIYEPMDPMLTDGKTHQLIGWKKEEADMLFLEAMKAAGVHWLRRNAMWMAVRFGGYWAWNTEDK